LAAKKERSYELGAVYDCKYCGTATALRSHRKNFFEFLRTRFSGKVPFRCTRCNRRFWQLIDPRDR
jgi:DNA-directed RNA polymerase subunit RPC12/RpoP